MSAKTLALTKPMTNIFPSKVSELKPSEALRFGSHLCQQSHGAWYEEDLKGNPLACALGTMGLAVLREIGDGNA